MDIDHKDISGPISRLDTSERAYVIAYMHYATHWRCKELQEHAQRIAAGVISTDYLAMRLATLAQEIDDALKTALETIESVRAMPDEEAA